MLSGMKKLLVCAVIGIACFMMANAPVSAEEWLPEKAEWMPDFSVGTSFYTKYIWRGQNLGDEPVMQNDVSISKYGLTFDFWTNYSLNSDKTIDGGRYQEYTEIDYTIDYTFNFGEMAEKMDGESLGVLDPLSMSVGYTFYTFPNVEDWDDKYFKSHEVYLGVSYDTLLNPSFTWYWDVDMGRGSYLVGGIGHTFEFDGGVTADIGTTVAYNYEQWTEHRGWSDLNVTGSVSVPFFEYFTVTPSVSYSVILDRDTYDDAQTNEFYGGLTITFDY